MCQNSRLNSQSNIEITALLWLHFVPVASWKLYRMQNFLTICLHTAFPEGTSGCLRSTRRPCTSGTQTSALKGRTIFLCPSTGKKKMSVCLVTSGLYPALLKLPEISCDSIEEMEFWCSQLYLTMDLSLVVLQTWMELLAPRMAKFGSKYIILSGVDNN